MASIMPKRTMSWAVIFMLVAASCALVVSRQRIEAAPSGEITRIDGVLQHQHAVGGGERNGAAGAAFAEDHRDIGHAERKAGVGRARDCLRLAALFGADAGIGAGGIHQRDAPECRSGRPYSISRTALR